MGSWEGHTALLTLRKPSRAARTEDRKDRGHSRQCLASPSPGPGPRPKDHRHRRARFPSLTLCPDHVADMRCLGCRPASGAATLAQVHTRATHPLAANIYHRDSAAVGAAAAAARLLSWAPLTRPGRHSISRFPSEHRLLHRASGPVSAWASCPPGRRQGVPGGGKRCRRGARPVVWAGSATPSLSPGRSSPGSGTSCCL